MQSEQINEIAAALAKAQGAMKNATMNRVNPHFKSQYADMAAVLDAIRKPLSDNGICVTQTIEIREGGQVLTTKVMHSSGQWLASEFPLPSSARPQELGSALTYARRYSLAAIVCNSADEDDDANAAEAKGQKVDADGKAKPVVQPQSVAPPIDPATGECTPHLIAVPDGKDKKPDWVAWAQLYIAAVKSSRTPDEADLWAEHSEDTKAAMKKAAPKVYERMIAAVQKVRTEMQSPSLTPDDVKNPGELLTAG